jgi:DNA mismatch repair protein MSH3
MVNSKTPKKQTTLSSFFGVKPPASSPVASSPAASSKPKLTAPPRKRPQSTAEDDDEELEDAPPLPPSRSKRTTRKKAEPVVDEDEEPLLRAPRAPRAKGTIDDDEDEELADAPAAPSSRPPRAKRTIDEDQDFVVSDDESVAAPKKKARREPPPPSSQPTTERYRYGGATQEQQEEEDPQRRAQKEKLREKFVKKLGRIEISRAEPTEGVAAEGDESEPEPEPEPAPKKKGKAAAAAKGPKLTPLEKQVVEIKKTHPDTVLVVEVGYKFRFFGEDARIASQNLNIMCIPGKMRFDNHPTERHLDKFASAMIPVHRLHVHVKRLVANGYKVGVVRQLETAALKAAGDNKSGPFERRLTNLYTKGTYVDDIDGLEGDDLSAGAGSGGASNTGFLLCITEKPGGGSGTDEKVHVGIVAVQPSTGEVIYDEFDDGFMRSEIETRLLHSRGTFFYVRF